MKSIVVQNRNGRMLPFVLCFVSQIISYSTFVIQMRNKSSRRWTWVRWRRAPCRTCSVCRGGSRPGCGSCPLCGPGAPTTRRPSLCSPSLRPPPPPPPYSHPHRPSRDPTACCATRTLPVFETTDTRIERNSSHL